MIIANQPAGSSELGEIAQIPGQWKAQKRLPSAEYLRERLAYDSETGVLTWKLRPRDHFTTDQAWAAWNARYPGTPAGSTHANARTSYVEVRIDGIRYVAHRIIWKLAYGVEPTALIDHRDGDGENNRLGNLREASTSQNHMNRRRAAPGLKGTCFNKRRNRWEARIKHHGKSFHLGRFLTQEEAHAAYCKKATELFGEFARAA